MISAVSVSPVVEHFRLVAYRIEVDGLFLLIEDIAAVVLVEVLVERSFGCVVEVHLICLEAAPVICDWSISLIVGGISGRAKNLHHVILTTKSKQRLICAAYST